MTEHIQAFATVAKQFIAWIESQPSTSSDNLMQLHAILGRLQTEASLLPQGAVNDESLDQTERGFSYAEVMERLSGVAPDRYTVVFNALDSSDAHPVETSLRDDLADIYRDIQLGFYYLDAGKVKDAAWQWRFDYFSHWGRHLVHAQTAIWQVLADRGGEDEG